MRCHVFGAVAFPFTEHKRGDKPGYHASCRACVYANSGADQPARQQCHHGAQDVPPGRIETGLGPRLSVRVVELRLLGARYGSIGGRLAAQLYLEDDDGEAVTLVQTALVAELEEIEWAELRAGGLRVDLWKEDGVFLAMARTP